MGPRQPSYPDTEREFEVLYVLLTNDEPTAAELQQIRAMRENLECDFATATGSRGRVTTDQGLPTR